VEQNRVLDPIPLGTSNMAAHPHLNLRIMAAIVELVAIMWRKPKTQGGSECLSNEPSSLLPL